MGRRPEGAAAIVGGMRAGREERAATACDDGRLLTGQHRGVGARASVGSGEDEMGMAGMGCQARLRSTQRAVGGDRSDPSSSNARATRDAGVLRSMPRATGGPEWPKTERATDRVDPPYRPTSERLSFDGLCKESR